MPFGHGARFDLGETGRTASLTLLSSFHCSRYNTNTGRLTTGMFEAVFAEARTILDTRA